MGSKASNSDRRPTPLTLGKIRCLQDEFSERRWRQPTTQARQQDVSSKRRITKTLTLTVFTTKNFQGIKESTCLSSRTNHSQSLLLDKHFSLLPQPFHSKTKKPRVNSQQQVNSTFSRLLGPCVLPHPRYKAYLYTYGKSRDRACCGVCYMENVSERGGLPRVHRGSNVFNYGWWFWSGTADGNSLRPSRFCVLSLFRLVSHIVKVGCHFIHALRIRLSSCNMGH